MVLLLLETSCKYFVGKASQGAICTEHILQNNRLEVYIKYRSASKMNYCLLRQRYLCRCLGKLSMLLGLSEDSFVSLQGDLRLLLLTAWESLTSAGLLVFSGQVAVLLRQARPYLATRSQQGDYMSTFRCPKPAFAVLHDDMITVHYVLHLMSKSFVHTLSSPSAMMKETSLCLTLQVEHADQCTLFASIALDSKLMFWDTAVVQTPKRGSM